MRMRMRSRMMRMLFVAFMVQLVAGSAWAAEPLVLMPGDTQVSPGLHYSYFEDAKAELKFEQAKELFEQGKFIPSNMETLSFGFTKSVYCT